MKKIRRFSVSFAVLFALMFCYGTSLQAAAVEETVELKGPDVQPGTCIGGTVGRVTIEHKDLDLAQTIVGEVLNKDKTDNDNIVTVRFRNGPPDTQMTVAWLGLPTPGDCLPIMGGNFLGIITTDANGRARARFVLENPFPGKGVKIRACVHLTGPTNGCDAGDEIYTGLFTEVFPPAP